MTATSRTIVHQGIAAYLGGTFQQGSRSYQGGALNQYGLGAVRAGYPKEVNENDSFAGLPAGTMSGCQMVVELGDDVEVRQANAGAPVVNGSGVITAGGIKQINYQVVLDCYHLSAHPHSEDAAADLDVLIEQIKQRIRQDRTLGGICMDGGETTKGIRTRKGRPGVAQNKRTGTWFTISFEVRVQFIA